MHKTHCNHLTFTMKQRFLLIKQGTTNKLFASTTHTNANACTHLNKKKHIQTKIFIFLKQLTKKLLTKNKYLFGEKSA